ncbi:hypothetical protein BayCH28_17570 [Mycolicibacterium sp. CH28]|uniref:hypothetical protein n=1 Tax=Mycolicibacterium sp. CH28 TaxID=2512237 RepID=UPI001081A798|nr:hypothetical protein [Mycolicibacterium sp. CH28]TGD86219.1 hypothetical protein BayCH28_17570 [Mycolicibacterium sp. CH28]
MGPAGFPAAAARPEFGSALFGLLSDPTPLPGIGSPRAAQEFITSVTGRSAEDVLAANTAPRFRHSTYGQPRQQHSVA